MFCAGAEGKDACYYDNGGPMICEDGVQCGMTSFGIDCADDTFISGYLDTAFYLDWIAANSS